MQTANTRVFAEGGAMTSDESTHLTLVHMVLNIPLTEKQQENLKSLH